MATLSQLPPTLNVTSADDDMEISSQLGHYENDIDVELDGPGDAIGDQDLDLLLDDARSVEAFQDTEMMHYDDVSMQPPTPRRVDSDNKDEQFHHEDLDLEIPEALVDQKNEHTRDNESTALELLDTFEENVLGDEHNSNGFAHPESQGETATHDHGTGHVEGAAPEDVYSTFRDDDGVLPESSLVHDVLDKSTDPPSGVTQLGEHPPPLHEEEATTGSPKDGNVSPHQTASDLGPDEEAKANALDQDAAENTIDLTNNANEEFTEQSVAHSIIVSYEDSRFSLFPPAHEDESSQFLIQDSSLASRSIAELLRACREVLGNDVSEEQELKIASEDLGLEISEESPHSFSTSLSEILEVYLDLHRLDGVASPDPFEISLEKQERFTAGLSRLRAAIADGRGMSQLWQDWGEDNETPLEHEAMTEQIVEANSGEKVDQDYLGRSNVEDDGREHNESLSGLDQVQSDEVDAAHSHNAPEDRSNIVEHQNAELEEQIPNPQTLPNEDPTEAVDEHDENVEHGISADIVAPVDGSREEVQEEEEEDLIDYAEDEPAEEARSSDSSTVVGDGIAAHGDTSNVEPPVQPQPDAEEHVALQDLQSYDESGLPEEQQETDAFGNSQFDNEFVGNFEQNDDDRAHEHYDYGSSSDAQANRDLGSAVQHPDLSASEQAVEQDVQQSFEAHEEEQFQQEEEWDQLIDHEEPHGAHEAEDNTEELLDETFQTALDQPQNAVPDDVIDHGEFVENDEITFEDEGAEGDGFGGDLSYVEQPSSANQPDESPPGKRSWADHLQGGDSEEGITPEAKRLRSA